MGIEGLEMLGGHIGNAASEKRRRPGALEFRAATDVEVGQQRFSLGRQENVRRFHVPVQHAVLMGVIQRSRQFRTQHANRRRPRPGDPFLPGRRTGGRKFPPAVQVRIHRLDQQSAGTPVRRRPPHPFEQIKQGATGQIRHVDQQQGSLG